MSGEMWAVISPAGELTWYGGAQTEQVRQLVSGQYAPGAVGTAWVRQPLRVMASDVALIAPEHYEPNPVAQQVIGQLSGGRITQPWRGHVALAEYEQDTGPGSIGEWLGPTEMSTGLRTAITAAIDAARSLLAQQTPVCPLCGQPPVRTLAGGSQAFCGTDDCPALIWNANKGIDENMEDLHFVDLSPLAGTDE